MTPRQIVIYVNWLAEAPPDTMVYVQPSEAEMLGFKPKPGVHLVASAGELTYNALRALHTCGEIPQKNLV